MDSFQNVFRWFIVMVSMRMAFTGTIRLLKLDIQERVEAGTSVPLSCIFELVEADLYSVKWYKGSEEFYRYVPKDSPPAQFFVLPGVQVNEEKSNEGVVWLDSVGLESSGIYRCEISADAPSFHTLSDQKEMIVYDLPDRDPQIVGGQTSYKVNDTVRINCTAERSKPAAMLEWYINGEKAASNILHKYGTVVDKDGLETSILGLEFVINQHHFHQNEIVFQCTATMDYIYKRNTEYTVPGENNMATVLESKGSPSEIRTSSNESPGCSTTSWLMFLGLLAETLIVGS